MVIAPVAEARQYQELARYVKAARGRAHFSQEGLAQRIGVSTGYVGHIEVGKQRPSPEVLRLIARALDVEYSELARRAGYADDDSDKATLRVDPDKIDVLRWLAQQPVQALLQAEAIVRALGGLVTRKPPVDEEPNPERDGHQD